MNSSNLIDRDRLLKVVKHLNFDVLEDYYHAEMARRLGLNPEVVRVVMTGSREPSKTFLDAVGFERVVLYRPIPKPSY